MEQKDIEPQAVNMEPRAVPKWHVHRRLYNWVIGWADTRFGFLALIILAVTEPVCVLIPADVLVIGMCLGKPKKSIKYGLTCAFFSVLGGTIAFLLGQAIGGERVVGFFEKITVGPFKLGEKAHLALSYYDKYDFWAISIAALTPVPYMLFSWVGGMANVSITKFIAISLVFRTMRFGSEAVFFYYLGERAKRLIEKYFNIATFIVIILLMLLVYGMRQLGKLF